MASVQRFIEHESCFVINDEKHFVSDPFDLTFLGFWLRKTAKGEVLISISQRTTNRLEVRRRELTPRNWGGSFDSCVLLVNRYVNGWIG